MIAYLVHLVFLCYTLMLAVRLIASWFSAIAFHPVIQLIGRFTDPYLNVFRKVIPPIGGALDLSPLLGFFTLQLAEHFLVGFLR
jgi:YggT family protein